MSERPTIGILRNATRWPCDVVGCQSGLPGQVVVTMLRPEPGYPGETHAHRNPWASAPRTYAICADCLARMMVLGMAQEHDVLGEMTA